MNALEKTILGEIERLAQLHDIIQFKSKAYDNLAVASSLKECAELLTKTSEVLIRDVVYQLSAKNFPFSSREKGRKPPVEDPIKILDKAQSLFPEQSALPPADLTLWEMPQILANSKERLTTYANNKDGAIAELMKLQSQVIDYLIGFAWLDL